jgi:hypothetical protein
LDESSEILENDNSSDQSVLSSPAVEESESGEAEDKEESLDYNPLRMVELQLEFDKLKEQSQFTTSQLEEKLQDSIKYKPNSP